MALREILTHHGASAGVFMPDLSSDGALYVELKHEDHSSSIKREREIDLNMQVGADESEPNLKRLKLEPVSCSLKDNMAFDVKQDDSDVSIKREHCGHDLPAGQLNGQLDINSVKGEPESCIDGVLRPPEEAIHFTEPKSCHEDKGPSIPDLLRNLPENCELMNLIKVARHSWLRNCEFLQHCAIRFLCVLSLDRYGNTSF